MSDEIYQRYLLLVQSMTLDARMGGITQATYIQNLTMIAKRMVEDAAVEKQE